MAKAPKTKQPPKPVRAIVRPDAPPPGPPAPAEPAPPAVLPEETATAEAPPAPADGVLRLSDMVHRGAKGIECPKCGCRHHHVYYTRQMEGEIRRRRVCRNCGWIITTHERRY